MLINDFLDKYYKQLVDTGTNIAVVVAKSMTIDGSLDEEGWVAWKPAKSNVTNDDITKFESKYNLTLPTQYIEYVTNRQFMDIQISGYTLYGINELNTLEDLISLFPENILSFGFFPIGSIDDSDFIALNTKSGEVVRLSYDDYSFKEILFAEFTMLIDFLSEQVNK